MTIFYNFVLFGTDDMAALKAEVKRLRKVESKYLKILEFAKSESSEDQN